MIDGSIVRAHQHAAGALGGQYLQAIGRSRDELSARGTAAVIPGKKNRLKPIKHDRHIYKERNFVERFFNRIKGFRRIATRYDKTATMFLGALTVVGILLWLKL